ncbi:Cytochrome b561 domain-containing protein [Mycena indigotica]|uniref:Cytochrome b561 domain-containing protein n=1 Tax=Mycena indigotica TaxID=2126181 RepID=A0A8H6VXR1_9AGAR|nr:Cytochrome b561 domain-containing protein [Mycena indigotica]KAF7292044.1 Cytochrome b561 domain-containing protein [Mycena indigotica]
MAKKPTDGVDYHDKMIIAHAVFACIATLFTAPAAILIGRYFRGRPWWFKAHLWLQSVTASCIIIVFAVGIVAVLSGASHIVQLTGPKADAHHDLGLAILILFLLQYLLGIAAHYTHSAGPAGAQKGAAFPTLSTPKHALRHLHVFCGVAMTALLYAGVKTGMDEWDTVSDMGTRVPSGIVVVYWLFFGIEVAAYLFGWVMEPLRAKKTQRAAASLDGGSEEKVAVEA